MKIYKNEKEIQTKSTMKLRLQMKLLTIEMKSPFRKSNNRIINPLKETITLINCI